MKKQKVKNANKTIIGHLNSFRNKFVFAEEIVQLFDVFLVSESKLNNTFPTNLFKINGYKTFRCDRNHFRGGLLLYENERVPCIQDHPNFFNLEILVHEVYQSNRKWLFLGVFKPTNLYDIEFSNRLGAILGYYSQKYDNVTIIGDFNITTENTLFQCMMQAYNLDIWII